MSSFFGKKDFTYTDSNDLMPLNYNNNNNNNNNKNNNRMQDSGANFAQGSAQRVSQRGGFSRVNDGLLNGNNVMDNNVNSMSLTDRIPGPVFAPTPGQIGLSPFCGTFYDQKFSGNHLEGIQIEPVLAVDSKARNHTKYPNPNYYDLQLNTTYKDVTKVELKFALIPNSGYVINKSNNLFYFQDRREQLKQCKYYQVEIPCGDWPAENAEGPSIASILEAELNYASCAYNHRKGCNVASSVPYNACICNCSTSMCPTAIPKVKKHGLTKKEKKCDKREKKGENEFDTISNCFTETTDDSCCETDSNTDTSSCCTTNCDTNSCSTEKSNNSTSCGDSFYDPPSKYSVSFCKYTRKFTIKQISGSGLFNIIFCGGLSKVGEQGTVTQPIMGVDRFLLPEIQVNEFQKSYIKRSIGPILGFSPRNLQGKLVYTSDGVINFDRDRYIILRMPGFERLQSNWDPLQGAFAIIAATRIANDFVFAKWDNDPYNSETYTKYFNPPLPNLSKIRIEFYNSCGEPFDFNGLDHLLLFDIGSKTQQTVFPIIPGPVDQC